MEMTTATTSATSSITGNIYTTSEWINIPTTTTTTTSAYTYTTSA